VQTDEFIPLTEQALLELLADRYAAKVTAEPEGRRRQPRWPFPGTVELWLTNAAGEQEHVLGRALNLSLAGIGVLLEEDVRLGQEVNLAIHQPEATFYGKAVVRHATLTEHGVRAGLEFVF
jgi:hypothetical protein